MNTLTSVKTFELNKLIGDGSEMLDFNGYSISSVCSLIIASLRANDRGNVPSVTHVEVLELIVASRDGKIKLNKGQIWKIIKASLKLDSNVSLALLEELTNGGVA